MHFCGRCGLTTKFAQQYTQEMELKEEEEKKDQELLIMKKQLDDIQKQVSTLILSLAAVKDQSQLNQTAKILYDAKIINVK
ncbi:MAG: hypothetical protein ACR2F1_02170 [Nitrososphaeraceae archaeon]